MNRAIMVLPIEALKNRNYRLYFFGQLTSMVGTWMQSTVLAWLVYQLSHSATWLGAITFLTQAPSFLISPVAGILADRQDRRMILLWTAIVGMLQATLLAVLVLTGKISLAQIAILSIVLGLINGFDLTTRHAFAADLVHKSELYSAIAWNSFTINGSRIIGPALAGVLIGPLGAGWCFSLNALSYAAVIWGLLSIRAEKREHPTTSSSPLQEFKDALRYIRQTPLIWRLIVLSTFISFFGFPYHTLLPVFAKEHLHGDASTLSWLMGISGVGAIVGTFALGFSTQRLLSHRIPIAMAMIGLALILLGTSRSLLLSLVACLLIGVFLMGTFPSINTAIQNEVDDSLRARVLSLYTMGFLGAMPLGSLLFGWLADRVGAGALEIAAGIVFLLSTLALNCFSRTKSVESPPWKTSRLS